MAPAELTVGKVSVDIHGSDLCRESRDAEQTFFVSVP